jgi:hypothetical protein
MGFKFHPQTDFSLGVLTGSAPHLFGAKRNGAPDVPLNSNFLGTFFPLFFFSSGLGLENFLAGAFNLKRAVELSSC